MHSTAWIAADDRNLGGNEILSPCENRGVAIGIIHSNNTTTGASGFIAFGTMIFPRAELAKALPGIEHFERCLPLARHISEHDDAVHNKTFIDTLVAPWRIAIHPEFLERRCWLVWYHFRQPQLTSLSRSSPRVTLPKAVQR